MTDGLAIIIPAHNEAGYIGACLQALAASHMPAAPVEVIVVANGCRDATVTIARQHGAEFDQIGWQFQVIDRAEGGKMGALNAGDCAARYPARVYLDADVTVSKPLIAQIADALATPDPQYASGTPVIAPPQSWVTKHYARFWQSQPFLTHGVPGFGIFAVNAAGRALWDSFPDIISDDTFVRLHFTPAQRKKLPAPYTWPMIEGFHPLVKVRRRQDQGVAEINANFPDLVENDDPKPIQAPGLMARALRDPLGFAVYACVALTTRLPAKNQETWARGR